MFYEQALSKSEIGRRTNISVTHVNRLLREGMRTGLVEIRLNPRSLKSLESSLIKTFDLRDARVVASSMGTEATRVDLGLAAARLFDELALDGATVAVGSGRTLLEMASRLPERSRGISLYPANLIVEQNLQITGVSANAVATIAWFRSRPSAKAWRLEMFFPSTSRKALMGYTNELAQTRAFEDLKKRICSLDVYFLGASEFRKDSQLARLQSVVAGSHSPGPGVGDVAFNFLGSDGLELDLGLGQMVVRIPTERLKRIAQGRKDVVLVAGGKGKAPIISTALGAGLCNTLVTDSDAAEELLKRPKTSIAPILVESKEEDNGKCGTKEETHISLSNVKNCPN